MEEAQGFRVMLDLEDSKYSLFPLIPSKSVETLVTVDHALAKEKPT